jgi:5-hydroxyisourate hydrolase
MSQITTHVLDTARGQPAAGVTVLLEKLSDAGQEEIGRASTDADGRIRDIGPEQLAAGTYRLVFAVADYFARLDRSAFFPEVAVMFTVDGEGQHYHVPLLLSPFGYTTYRGS